MKRLNPVAVFVVALGLALGLVALLPLLSSQSQGFIDRIVRPCSSGAVTQANVIANPNSSGNINVTPCTGGSLTINGVPVIPNGLPDPGSNGFVVRTAANTTVARTIGGSNGISVGNGTGVAGNPDIAGVNAAADGATKGVGAYNAGDFNSATGIITLDYTNGQSASALLKGYLTSADWSAFNAKQPAGNYITALTGDGTAAGPGSVAFTLANVVAAGSCTACNLTYDAKGRITIAGNGAGGITNSAGANVVPKSNGTNLVASRISDNGTDQILINGDTNTSITVSAGAGYYFLLGGAGADNAAILSAPAISLDSGAGTTVIGDVAAAGNSTTLTLNDSISTVAVNGIIQGALFQTATNCADSAGAAACGSAAAGSVVIDAAATSVVVSTTAATADSQIIPVFDSSLGARLGVTCNTTIALPAITARTAGTFTITIAVAPITDRACFSYFIVN